MVVININSLGFREEIRERRELAQEYIDGISEVRDWRRLMAG